MTTRAIPQGICLRVGKYDELEFSNDILPVCFSIPIPMAMWTIIVLLLKRHMLLIAKLLWLPIY